MPVAGAAKDRSDPLPLCSHRCAQRKEQGIFLMYAYLEGLWKQVQEKRKLGTGVPGQQL